MSATSNTVKLRVGDVIRYEVRAGEERQMDRDWCREGTAVVIDGGVALDTYRGSGNDQHRLTVAELTTAEVQFNVNDYDELDRWRPDRGKWLTYAEADRGRITSQHGLQQRLFIRKDAKPDHATMVANAQQAVDDALSAVRSAEWILSHRREELARIQSEMRHDHR